MAKLRARRTPKRNPSHYLDLIREAYALRDTNLKLCTRKVIKYTEQLLNVAAVQRFSDEIDYSKKVFASIRRVAKTAHHLKHDDLCKECRQTNTDNWLVRWGKIADKLLVEGEQKRGIKNPERILKLKRDTEKKARVKNTHKSKGVKDNE